MIFIGIDPGTTGAVAIISGKGEGVTSAFVLMELYDFSDPSTIEGLFAIPNYNSFAMLEKVSAMPGQGVSSTFKFGTAFGRAIGWLEMAKIPFEYVTPGKWWKAVSDSAPKGPDKKASALELARRLFPSAATRFLTRKKDHSRAEALLIAEYCRRMKSNF